ncbi:virulence-associated protein E [Nitrospirillum pindoramense]|uniref:Virulence-associated protein E n=2 Tax=Nitrospirillum amazonense TaxID=28077 RepID=A0A560H6K1_9PROT|nr:virulence-associated protein E [Nitrospirillum amazonense]
MEPGLKFDSVLVLHGRKGGGKSSVLRALGGAHFAEVRHLGLKGSRGNHPMIGKWLGEVPEIDRLISGDGDAAEFKSWISLRADRVLKPYARVHEDIPRAWVLAGTTNEVGWIRDTQNERRWWVVTVGDTLDVQGLAKVREQLLAEAVTRWPTEPLYMETEELRRALKEALESFAAENPLEVKVGRWVAEETAPALRLGGLSGIALNVDDLPDCDVTNPRRRGEIRAALTALGMTSKRPRVNGRRAPEVWGWISQEAAQACVAAYGQDYESEF